MTIFLLYRDSAMQIIRDTQKCYFPEFLQGSQWNNFFNIRRLAQIHPGGRYPTTSIKSAITNRQHLHLLPH